MNTNGENIGGVKALIDDLAARGLHESSKEERKKAYREEQEAKKGRKGFFSYYFKAVSEPADSPTKVTERQVLDAILAAGIPPLEAIEKQSQYSMLVGGLSDAMKKEATVISIFRYVMPQLQLALYSAVKKVRPAA